jgi:Site-specific recombinases, DNA invertase Pin homologs
MQATYQIQSGKGDVKSTDLGSLRKTREYIYSLLNKFVRDILLHILAFQSENEWQKIKSRQAQGIAVAKASGKQMGRPKSVVTKKEIKIAKQYQSREIDLDTALKILKIKKTAFYSLCQKVKAQDG